MHLGRHNIYNFGEERGNKIIRENYVVTSAEFNMDNEKNPWPPIARLKLIIRAMQNHNDTGIIACLESI
jgi:small ligand-binding sensory domain FIST